jgi:hypothetical protein
VDKPTDDSSMSAKDDSSFVKARNNRAVSLCQCKMDSAQTVALARCVKIQRLRSSFGTDADTNKGKADCCGKNQL